MPSRKIETDTVMKHRLSRCCAIRGGVCVKKREPRGKLSRSWSAAKKLRVGWTPNQIDCEIANSEKRVRGDGVARRRTGGRKKVCGRGVRSKPGGRRAWNDPLESQTESRRDLSRVWDL
jgi:hypothetical protein